MKKESALELSYQEADYLIIGHGPRSMQVLMDAFEQADGSRFSDMYGRGEVIEAFEAKMAKLLGKEAAVFFPSGTMAQQIALRIWCDRRGFRTAAYHPLCHLEIHEERGLHELHGIRSILLGDPDRLITLEDIQAVREEIGCLLLELPQREIGGQLPSYEELQAISAWCREQGIPIHLDGARLFEIVPYYGRSEAEICSLFDSVYVSFYKGVGGIAGAILAGDADLAQQSKVWKRRHGGDLVSLYPYIVSSEHYLDQRLPLMETYLNGARDLSSRFNRCSRMRTVPEQPVSNMFHLHLDLPMEQASALLEQTAKETGVAFLPYLKETSPDSCAGEIHIGDRYARIPAEKLDQAFKLLEELAGQA
ncbi:threonine aldolase family protein [Paenibacillus sp. D51F]